MTKKKLRASSLLLCCLTLASCGGGGGGGTSVVVDNTAPTRNYKQQIIGLLQGSYSVACQDASLTAGSPSYDATMTISDNGVIGLSGKTSVDMSVQSAVFSVAPSYIQNSTFNNVAPGIAFLGKSGNISVGMNFGVGSDKTYELAQLYFQNTSTQVVSTCTPKSAQKIGTAWGSTALINALTSGFAGVLPCADGSTITLAKDGTSVVMSTATSKTVIDLSGQKMSELYQAPIDQINPTSSLDDNFAYTATFADGSRLAFTRYANQGVSRFNGYNPVTRMQVVCSK